MAIATLYTELDLDLSKFQAKQRKLLDDIKKVGADSETALQRSFMNLGVTSDSVYKLMVEKARVSYEQIAQSGKASAAEQVRAQQAMVSQINAINAKIAESSNAHYATLGMKSAADVKQRISDVTMAATAQQAIVGKSSEDWMRIERAKNEKLKELNKEMTGDHEMSMASMTRAVLRFYAAYYVISTVAQVVAGAFMSGIKAIDDMKVSVVSVAAQITTMQGTTGDVAQNYKDNVKYAEALIPVLQQVDANSFANLSQIQKMNMAMTNQGVILDVNNVKQIESFTALTNAIALFTQGQDKEKQASQEIRSLMSGQVRAGDMVAMQMDALIKRTGDYKDGLKGLVKEGKAHGDTLERMQPYLIGIVAASGDIQKTWMAVSSSLETAWNIIQRGLFKDVYKDLVENGMIANTWIKKNQEDIVIAIKNTYETISFATQAVIASLILVAAISITQSIIAGNAWAWFALRYEAMSKTVTMATSSMTIGWTVFVAALVGFSIGKYLSNEFEWARFAGISMVYGIMDAWEFFVSKLKIGWEYLKIAAAATSDMSQEESDAMSSRAKVKIKTIREEYEAEKKVRDGYRDQQFKDESDAGKALAKAAADAAKDKIKTPVVPPGKDPALKDSVKDHMEIIRAKMQEDKSYYDEQVKTADQVAKLAQRAGQDEYKTIKDEYNFKENALNDWLQKQYKSAEDLTATEAKAATISKDGIAKKFDAEAVLQSKYDKIFADYNKRFLAYEGEKAIKIEDANKMTIQTMANLYKTIGDYSETAMQYEIEQIKEKYKNDGRWATATIEQRIVLEKAMNTEIFNLRNKNQQALINLQLSYLEVTKGIYSTDYKIQQDLSLENQAAKIQQEMDANKIFFDKAAWLAEKKKDILAKELEDKAIYYMAIGGMEDKANAASLAAIELRRQKNIKIYNDVDAANQQSQQDKMKLVQDEITGITSRYDTEHKYQQETIANAIAIFDNASALMNKESKEYQLMQDAKKAAQIAELALVIQKNLAILAGLPAIAAATTAAAGQAITQGAAATLTAGTGGDGYTAFARVAAMMVIVAAVLSAAGIVSGGASSANASTTASLPASTVLGATAGTGSQSISNSYKLMEDTYDMENTKLTNIYNQLKNLNSNITGLVTNIVKYGASTTSWNVPADTVGFAESISDRMINQNMGFLTTIGNFLNKPLAQINKWTDAIFGGETSSTVGASGISINAATVKDLINGLQVSAQQYARIVTTTKGGWFSSDSVSAYNQYAALNSSVTTMFTKVFKNVGQTLVSIADGLGMDTQAALNYAFASINIDLQGKTSEQINTAITEYFSNIADTAVKDLFGFILEQYQELDEGLYETAVRVITDKEIILSALKQTNQVFYGGTASIIAFSESIIDMAGGLDKFTESVNTYYDKFFSDTEKQANLQSNLLSVFSNMNLVLPATRSGYKNLVESLNLNTEAGKEAYVTLMKLAESADTFYTGLEDAQQKLIDAQGKVIDTIQGYVDKLRSARESMKMEGMEAAAVVTANAKAMFNAVLVAARGGDFSGIATLDNTLSTITSSANSTAGFSTLEEYQRNFYQTQNSIAELEALTGHQLTMEEKTLSVLQEQLNKLAEISTTTIDALAVAREQQATAALQLEAQRTLTAQAELARVQAQLESTQSQLSSTQSQLSSARQGAGVAGGDPTVADWIFNPIGSFFDSIWAKGGAFSNGNVIPFASGDIVSSPHYFPMANGMGLMGEAGPEAIMPLTRVGGKLGVQSTGNNATGNNVILIEEVRKLREELKTTNLAITKNTAKTAKTLDRWDLDGLPAERVLS